MKKSKKNAKYALFAVQLFLAASAIAAEDDNNLKSCLDMQGKEPPDKVLVCYNQIAQKQQATSESKKYIKLLLTEQNRGLAEEWTPTDAPLNIYKKNYILIYSQSSEPNNAPTTPTASTQVPYSYSLDKRDVKYQLSLKAHLLGVNRHALWIGYTQLSLWQFYDTKHSSPFRGSNYEPELIYSYCPENLLFGPKATVAFLNAGLSHQSNGEPLPRSRGWTSLYIQAGLERDFGDMGRFAVLPRLWARLPYGNPDLAYYLGRGDIELRYSYGQGVYTAIAKEHSLQIDLAYPLPRLHGVQLLNTNLHLQYFNGYGASLIDYNQSHYTFGIGFSLPFE